jgi:hypothetical protein
MLNDNGFEIVSDNDLLVLSAGLALTLDRETALRNGRVALAIRR